ncbi:MAG TPA: NTP transferase domain-containing protein, partial [Rhodocyclaceae bacterium]|nr:NTP transferase domain-containing protein [Rhodocyclaceae bacterium]
MTHLPTVVVSAAGRGTRMGSAMPKCLIRIRNKPLIHWQLNAIASFARVIVVVGFRAPDVV